MFFVAGKPSQITIYSLHYQYINSDDEHELKILRIY